MKLSNRGIGVITWDDVKHMFLIYKFTFILIDFCIWSLFELFFCLQKQKTKITPSFVKLDMCDHWWGLTKGQCCV